MKFPPLWAIAVTGLFCAAFYFSVSETARERQRARSLEIERSTFRVIDHVCAPWKSDSPRFDFTSESRRNLNRSSDLQRKIGSKGAMFELFRNNSEPVNGICKAGKHK
jgi:hypothetical protein